MGRSKGPGWRNLQDLQALSSWQGLLAVLFRHRGALLAAPDSSACSSAMFELIKWAADPQIRSIQDAQGYLGAVSIVLTAFKEPPAEGAHLLCISCVSCSAMRQAAVDLASMGISVLMVYPRSLLMSASSRPFVWLR